ncbi:hypothetical protein G6O69_09105 [Pseudenhygromyxa sp. WMMC2535]|uniref:DUF5818 domain-containing protein n=1 Tax=Pseudenhygromyxa sp. WMMC2535 TaxID=2712867 RepID=UPI0015525CA8|nr:DUF5818 domain-containing protein [Pseudenhygromyxa sp. WMMC2535]NVB37988.1 hypothetical protein [Pseudenhygromyxa sp. WMMC2535]
MSKQYTGTVRKSELEGGFLELETEGGEVFRLSGPQAGLSPGKRVRVTGRVERGGFGIHMSGPALAVEKVEAL